MAIGLTKYLNTPDILRPLYLEQLGAPIADMLAWRIERATPTYKRPFSLADADIWDIEAAISIMVAGCILRDTRTSGECHR